MVWSIDREFASTFQQWGRHNSRVEVTLCSETAQATVIELYMSTKRRCLATFFGFVAGIVDELASDQNSNSG